MRLQFFIPQQKKKRVLEKLASITLTWSFVNHADGRGAVNPKGLEYYNNLINELLSHGM
jgi:beta-glucosidase/6-phospho-beta-glucosidase/beta-galactosidase